MVAQRNITQYITYCITHKLISFNNPSLQTVEEHVVDQLDSAKPEPLVEEVVSTDVSASMKQLHWIKKINKL